ncbi:hypothetical protein BaRGS_00019786, partial [Batillaria attramentaria]
TGVRCRKSQKLKGAADSSVKWFLTVALHSFRRVKIGNCRVGTADVRMKGTSWVRLWGFMLDDLCP